VTALPADELTEAQSHALMTFHYALRKHEGGQYAVRLNLPTPFSRSRSEALAGLRKGIEGTSIAKVAMTLGEVDALRALLDASSDYLTLSDLTQAAVRAGPNVPPGTISRQPLALDAVRAGNAKALRLALERGSDAGVVSALHPDGPAHNYGNVSMATLHFMALRATTGRDLVKAQGSLECARVLAEFGAPIAAQALNRDKVMVENPAPVWSAITRREWRDEIADDLCALVRQYVTTGVAGLETLLRDGATDGYTPLTAAVYLGLPHLARELVRLGADVTLGGNLLTTDLLSDARVNTPKEKVDMMLMMLTQGIMDRGLQASSPQVTARAGARPARKAV